MPAHRVAIAKGSANSGADWSADGHRAGPVAVPLAAKPAAWAAARRAAPCRGSHGIGYRRVGHAGKHRRPHRYREPMSGHRHRSPARTRPIPHASRSCSRAHRTSRHWHHRRTDDGVASHVERCAGLARARSARPPPPLFRTWHVWRVQCGPECPPHARTPRPAWAVLPHRPSRETPAPRPARPAPRQDPDTAPAPRTTSLRPAKAS